MCSFNRGNIEGTNSSKICVWCLMFVRWLVLWIDLTEGRYICEKSLEMCICLWPEFDCPEVTLCGWQDIKIQLLLLLLPHGQSWAGLLSWAVPHQLGRPHKLDSTSWVRLYLTHLAIPHKLGSTSWELGSTSWGLGRLYENWAVPITSWVGQYLVRVGPYLMRAGQYLVRIRQAPWELGTTSRVGLYLMSWA